MNQTYQRPIDFSDALSSLYPTATWRVINDPTDYNNIIWEDIIAKPTKQILEEEIIKLDLKQKSNEYKEKRISEYPDFCEYLDAVVKGDLAQQQAYIDACLAVKAKYPKPEGA